MSSELSVDAMLSLVSYFLSVNTSCVSLVESVEEVSMSLVKYSCCTMLSSIAGAVILECVLYSG